MKPVTRKDQLASLQDIRLGDLPAPVYELIAELLAQFAEGTLYDAANGAGISQEGPAHVRGALAPRAGGGHV